jgi:hypothetical protein
MFSRIAALFITNHRQPPLKATVVTMSTRDSDSYADESSEYSKHGPEDEEAVDVDKENSEGANVEGLDDGPRGDEGADDEGEDDEGEDGEG